MGPNVTSDNVVDLEGSVEPKSLTTLDWLDQCLGDNYELRDQNGAVS